MDPEVLHTDLCSRVLLQLQQISADLQPLTKEYVETHGLHRLAEEDVPEGNAPVDPDTWAKMTMEERVLSNITAYLDFEKRLMQVIKEQVNSLLQEEGALHSRLDSMQRQVSALRSQLEHLGTIMGFKKELDEDLDEVDRLPGGVFERKVRGYHILKQLEMWAMRSIRDFRKLHREVRNLAIRAGNSTESSVQ
ncbi:ciliary neurotrophic factor [Dendropsophus ebraccatus]|uniref:ciliary neurotrophic factor n=1 Tax=Dendropsophus ebraccatus TaxID=150705 RepID=UPI003831C327